MSVSNFDGNPLILQFFKLLLEKAMAETMWGNKVTINTNTNQYHLVVFFSHGLCFKDHLFREYAI